MHKPDQEQIVDQIKTQQWRALMKPKQKMRQRKSKEAEQRKIKTMR